jgi:hypothetical protein
MIVSSLKSWHLWHLFGCEMMWERAGAASSQVPIFLNKPHGPGNSENGRGEMWDCDLSRSSPLRLIYSQSSCQRCQLPLHLLHSHSQRKNNNMHPQRTRTGEVSALKIQISYPPSHHTYNEKNQLLLKQQPS